MTRRGPGPKEYLAEQFERELRRTIAREVHRLRNERGLTFEELGEVSGVHWRHIQKVELDGVNLTLLTLCRLAAGLGVSPAELLGWTSTPHRMPSRP